MHVLCSECGDEHTPCAVAYPHQCLLAQGWCRPRKNWYCHECSAGWWKAPQVGHVTFKHKQDLLGRIATMAGFSRRAHDEINRSSSWPPEDRRIGAVEATNEPPATPATRLVGSTMMPRMCGGVRPLDQRIAEINAPLEDRPIGARLGPAPLPPPLAQVADTARPLAAGPDPFFTPGETSVLRAIAAELESAGHNVRGFGACVLDGGGISSLPREISKQAQQLFDLAIRLNDAALARKNATSLSTTKASPSEAHPARESRKVSPWVLPHGFALLARVVLHVVARLRPARHGPVMLVCFG